MNFVVAITGPAGAGKTTISAILVKKIERSVNIDVDHVKHFIVNGFKYDDSKAGIEQWKLMGGVIGEAAKKYHDSGYNVIINGYLDVKAWKEITQHVEFDHRFLLFPSIGENVERDKTRSKDIQMGAEAIEKHHKDFTSNNYYSTFHLLNTTKTTIPETVERILHLISS